jgi:hypothetical protein
LSFVAKFFVLVVPRDQHSTRHHNVVCPCCAWHFAVPGYCCKLFGYNNGWELLSIKIGKKKFVLLQINLAFICTQESQIAAAARTSNSTTASTDIPSTESNTTNPLLSSAMSSSEAKGIMDAVKRNAANMLQKLMEVDYMAGDWSNYLLEGGDSDMCKSLCTLQVVFALSNNFSLLFCYSAAPNATNVTMRQVLRFNLRNQSASVDQLGLFKQGG